MIVNEISLVIQNIFCAQRICGNKKEDISLKKELETREKNINKYPE